MELTDTKKAVLKKVHAYNRGTEKQDLEWIRDHVAGIDGFKFSDIANFAYVRQPIPAQRFLGKLTEKEIQAFKELAEI